MTYNKFMTQGKRTSKATREILREVFTGLDPKAQKALLDERNDYMVRYAFGYPDNSAVGTGISWPTLPGQWMPQSHGYAYYERENHNWKPIRLTSQGYRLVQTIDTDTYATAGYSAGSYAQLAIKRITGELAAEGMEVYIRPVNFYHRFQHSVPGVHGCWGWSGEEFQVWAREKQQEQAS